MAIQIEEASEQRTRGLTKILAILFLMTVAVHLCWGVFFYTSGQNNAPKTSLKLTGEAFLTGFPGWDTDHERDATVYNRSAYEALCTGVPRSREGVFFDHAPVYWYFLAACYWIGGIRYLSIAIPQAVLSGLIGVLLASAAWRLAPRNNGLAAVTASLLIFASVRMATFVGYINPACLLVCLFCVAFVAVTQLPDLRASLIFITAVLLATYTMATFFLVTVASALWLALRFWQTRRALYVLCAILILAGAGVKVAVGMRGGDSLRDASRGVLWEANNPYAETLGWWSLWNMWEGNPRSEWNLSDSQIERYADYLKRADNDQFKAACLWIRENPAQYAKLCFVRFRASIGPITASMKPANRLLSTAWWLLVFPAGFYGVWKYRKLPASTFAILVSLALVSFETVVMAGLQPRYRLPMDMMLVAYASVVYAELAACWFGIQTSKVAGRTTTSVAQQNFRPYNNPLAGGFIRGIQSP